MEEAKQAIDASQNPSPLELSPATPARPINRNTEHLGRTIVAEGEFWEVGGQRFESVSAAKAHIEATTLRAER